MITIVDYKAGNITSVQRALNSLGVESKLTPDPEIIRRAEKVIFPGVGQAASAMKALRERGMDQALRDAFARGIPILGICLGAQIVLSRSEEGDTECLNILPGECKRFAFSDPALKIPHMGWNQVRVLRDHPVLQGMDRRAGILFRPCLLSPAERPGEHSGRMRLRDRLSGGDWVGKSDRYAVSPREERSRRTANPRNFAAWNGAAREE